MTNVAHSLQIRTLRAQVTLAASQCCDLKLDTAAGERHWLCRMPKGHTDHRVTIEHYDNETGRWETTGVFIDPEDQ